ncbi:MAG: hypothetical protein HY901_10925 [Deltaproteobacteria bacterium]|nr:hypothetical protein [Deltaproteobacteria bacterium]
MRKSLGRLGLVVSLSILAACPPSSPSSEPDAGLSPLPPMRTGTAELVAWRGSSITVHDATRVGNRIGFIAGSGGSHERLFVSEDLGATWSRRDFDAELAYALVLTKSDAFVLARRRQGSSSLPGTRVLKVGADGKVTEVGLLKAEASWFGPAGAAGFEVQRDGAAQSWVYSRFDAASGTIQEQSAPLAAGEEDCLPEFQSADGEQFAAACYSLAQRCRLTVRPATSLAVSRDCLSYQDWPIPFRATQRDAVADGQVLRVWEDQGHLFARSLTGGAVGPLGPVLDLGVGTGDLAMSEPVGKWGGLIKLIDGSSPPRRRLVDLRQGQPHDVALPRSPCLDDDACPDLVTSNFRVDQRLLRVLPLGEGRYLTVYQLVPLQERQTPPPLGETLHLLARIAQDGEGTVSVLDEATVFSGPPNLLSDVPAQTELESTCARALSCFSGITTMEACLKYWLQVRSGPSSPQDLALQRFLSTPSGCDGFQTSFPALTAARGESCAPQCVAGHALFACAPADLHEVLDCEALGTTCLAGAGKAACATQLDLPCEQCDASGRALQCRFGALIAAIDCGSRGETCVPPGDGQYTAFCSPGSCPSSTEGAWACMGSVRVSCMYASPSKPILSSEDCGRLSMDCSTRWSAEPGCSAPTRTCRLEKAECLGQYLRYCAMDEQRFVDCAAIGFSTCQPPQAPGTEAHCIP